MDDIAFNELLNSTKEAKQILGKKATSSRTFYIDESDGRWQKIRRHYKSANQCYVRNKKL